jgi:hypothetical protein
MGIWLCMRGCEGLRWPHRRRRAALGNKPNMVRHSHYSRSPAGSFHEKPQEKEDLGGRRQGKHPRLGLKLNNFTPGRRSTIEAAMHPRGGTPPGRENPLDAG